MSHEAIPSVLSLSRLPSAVAGETRAMGDIGDNKPDKAKRTEYYIQLVAIGGTWSLLASMLTVNTLHTYVYLYALYCATAMNTSSEGKCKEKE